MSQNIHPRGMAAAFIYHCIGITVLTSTFVVSVSDPSSSEILNSPPSFEFKTHCLFFTKTTDLKIQLRKLLLVHRRRKLCEVKNNYIRNIMIVKHLNDRYDDFVTSNDYPRFSGIAVNIFQIQEQPTGGSQ